MKAKRQIGIATATAAVVLALVAGGCGSDESKPAGGSDKQPAATEQPKAPLIPKREVADWCREHAVPESVCTRCNESLVAEFKKKGDWCNEHDLPESQCTACHPELDAKFKAMAPKLEGEK